MVLAIRRQVDDPDPTWLKRLGEITAETLVLDGGPRSHIRPGQVAELARRIPRSRTETIPVGHLIHRDAPEAFTTAALTFLRAPQTAGSTDSAVRPAMKEAPAHSQRSTESAK
ncbi:alpha/beta hydrolase [Actinoallomurus sp. NPDC050550]|uniref:alpha/beta fold hydrolase n=1 Tax=Actinoallomurus sp. NPDC050550 TaxID=3154937 RepID=UPI0033E468A5